MYPPRHLVDSWIEALDWYEKCDACLKELESKTTDYDEIHSLILRGIDIIKEPSINMFLDVFNERDVEESLKVSGCCATKQLSRLKFESCSQGKQLLQQLIEYDRNLGKNSVITRCRSLLWKNYAVTLKRKICTMEDKCKVSTNEVKLLLSVVETPCNTTHLLQGNTFLDSIYTSAYIPLKTCIEQTEEIEKELSSFLSSLSTLKFEIIASKDLENYIAHLKDMRTKMKNTKYTLKPDNFSSLEYRLNKNIKDLHWLLNASKHKILFQSNLDMMDVSGTASDNQSVNVVSDESTMTSKPPPLSWQTLTGMYDKMPKKKNLGTDKQIEEGLDAAIYKVCTNVTKLKTFGEEWETKVQNKLGISPRGFKRRRRTIPEIEGKKLNKNIHITTIELEELINQKILSYVSVSPNICVLKIQIS